MKVIGDLSALFAIWFRLYEFGIVVMICLGLGSVLLSNIMFTWLKFWNPFIIGGVIGLLWSIKKLFVFLLRNMEVRFIVLGF